ncbi:hypothetical protein CCACVL1_04103 [Corchorus capsularis]|uniref:Uncharacterized protein n=1 Tax=Corchorus capsularis TaxID=210143 RepID=A0A1R3JUX2_COCAP|nr:hypothetical protein CCACVL1_04103 [Corchorus capsularis]
MWSTLGRGVTFYIVVYGLGKEITIYLEHEIDIPIVLDEAPILIDGGWVVVHKAETGKAEAKENEASFEAANLDLDDGEERDDEDEDENEEYVDKNEADDDENLAAYLVRSRACTEDEEDPERLVALERILKSVGRGKRQKTALETQGGDVEHVDPLEEILRERAAEDASNLDGEADEDERGYQSPVYLSDDHHSLVGSDEDPEHDNAQWRKSSPSCPWFLYVGWNEEIKAIQIRNMGDGNTCTENYKNKAVTGDGPFSSELLSALGKDGNDQIYPVAWALVERENRETLTWFLDLLAKDLDFGVGDGFTLTSDKQKVPAVQPIIPKKLGRPPKDKAVPKRRGRPPTDKGIFGNQAPNAVDNGDHAAKRRGRPETNVGKTSYRGYGHYFLEKTRKMTFYGEYRPNKRNQASSSTSQAIGSSNIAGKSTMTTSTKRKSHDANPIGTHESVN